MRLQETGNAQLLLVGVDHRGVDHDLHEVRGRQTRSELRIDSCLLVEDLLQQLIVFVELQEDRNCSVAL